MAPSSILCSSYLRKCITLSSIICYCIQPSKRLCDQLIIMIILEGKATCHPHRKTPKKRFCNRCEDWLEITKGTQSSNKSLHSCADFPRRRHVTFTSKLSYSMYLTHASFRDVLRIPSSLFTEQGVTNFLYNDEFHYLPCINREQKIFVQIYVLTIAYT